MKLINIQTQLHSVDSCICEFPSCTKRFALELVIVFVLKTKSWNRSRSFVTPCCLFKNSFAYYWWGMDGEKEKRENEEGMKAKNQPPLKKDNVTVWTVNVNNVPIIWKMKTSFVSRWSFFLTLKVGGNCHLLDRYQQVFKH